MIENILKEKIQSKFYTEIVSETQKTVSKLSTELEFRLLALDQEDRVLAIEQARKETEGQMKNLKGTHPFNNSIAFSLARKSTIDSFSYKKIESDALYNWVSRIKGIDTFLNLLKNDVSTLAKQVASVIVQSGPDEKRLEIEDVISGFNRVFIKEFEAQGFYLDLGTDFFDELEKIETLCTELDSTTIMLKQTLAKERTELSTIRLRQYASNLGALTSDIEKVNKGIFDGMIDNFYRHVFPPEIKDSLVRPLSLYEHDKHLQGEIDAVSGTNVSERDQYLRDPAVKNLAIMTLNQEATRVALVDCHKSFIGLFIDHCEPEVFVSLFLSNQFIQPVNWIGHNKDIHHFVFNIEGFLKGENTWEHAHNCFLKNGQPFGKDSIRTAGKGNPISESKRMVIDEAVRKIKDSRSPV